MEDVTLGGLLLLIPVFGFVLAFTAGLAIAVAEYTYEFARRIKWWLLDLFDRKFFK